MYDVGDQRTALSRIRSSWRAPVRNSVPAAVDARSPSPASITPSGCRAERLGGDSQGTFQQPASSVLMASLLPERLGSGLG
eukprot:428971-Rhodomonas_salina.1